MDVYRPGAATLTLTTCWDDAAVAAQQAISCGKMFLFTDHSDGDPGAIIPAYPARGP